MKTIKEKAKAYEEAIRKLRGIMPNWERLSYNGKTFLQDLIHIFPELKESEGERIRKAIINIFATHKDYEVYFGVSVEDIRVWLERQGEQKPIETTWKPSEEQMKVLDEVLNFAANHESPYWNDYIFGILNNLIRQLKKLKA